MRLKDQVAVVTGGSRGIGRGIVKALAAEGAKVGFVYKGSVDSAKSLEEEVKQSGGTAQAFQCDVAKYDEVEACVKKIEEALGGVNILVNNAGVIRDGLFVGMSQEDWNLVIQTNLGGTFNFCRILAMPLARKRKGRIINISSVAATHTNKGQTNYSASKGAVNSFTRALAVELAGRNVTVNAVAPGFIETEMTEVVRNKAGDVIKKLIPMGRLGLAEDIAKVVVFLASDEAGYMTGQVLTVDGGLSLGRRTGLIWMERLTLTETRTLTLTEVCIMQSRDQIYQKVSATLVEALNVEEDEISPAATLQGDLGAESIDFLDIVFRLEREFGIKIPRNELFPESIFQGDPDFVSNGKVTDKGLAELRDRMPFADIQKFETNPEMTKISDLFTVEMITKYIERKLVTKN